MNEDVFWQLIHECSPSTPDPDGHQLAASLTARESVLRAPQRFMPYANDLVWAEALLYVPDNAYEHLTGDEWDRSTRYSYESYSNRAGWTDA